MASDDDDDAAPPPPSQSTAAAGGYTSSFSRSQSAIRSRSSSPRPSPGPPSSPVPFRFSPAAAGGAWRAIASAIGAVARPGERRRGRAGLWGRRRKGGGGRAWWRRRGVVAWAAVVAFFFVMNWWMFSRLQDAAVRRRVVPRVGNETAAVANLGEQSNYRRDRRLHKLMFSKLLALAAHALAEAEHRPEPKDLWQEPLISSASWTPCADQHISETYNSSSSKQGKNGYILVSANGGINQQRIAICNAVAIARLLNATLVIPHFLYSSVWRDRSQFSDLYQEDHFINYLKPDVRILKELPLELRSLDLEAIGSLVIDTDVMKEAKPSVYVKKILPILLKNRVVHFVGFGNRLAFDPIPFELQRLRCRCNFHALQFVKKIQETGALLVQRMHGDTLNPGLLINNLLGPFGAKSTTSQRKSLSPKVSRYLAVHLRFEIDMAAYSMCYFGGGKDEEEELEAYRAVHFPALTLLRKTKKIPSAASLRSEGRCPLTPEEAVLMLAALGFKRKTSIYVAGANIYGGKSRMAAFRNLYPNLVTKESLLSSSEIEPFRNFSSQLAALDFIVCAAADAFAMTDPGSQFSSLISGFRMYYGGGRYLTIRPNKRRLASIFSKNRTIEWKEFEERVRKANKESKVVQERPVARSVYRHPRCPECMCQME